jgi:hypothetical protein
MMMTTHFSARFVLLGTLLLAGTALAKPKDGVGFECPKLSKNLTTLEVFNARQAAINAGNIDLAFCYYDENAVVVMPNAVVRGREAIKQAFLQFGSLFGGAFPEPSSVTVEGETLMVTFSLETADFSIPDGADVFIVRSGRIQTQVVHDTIVPTAP